MRFDKTNHVKKRISNAIFFVCQLAAGDKTKNDLEHQVESMHAQILTFA